MLTIFIRCAFINSSFILNKLKGTVMALDCSAMGRWVHTIVEINQSFRRANYHDSSDQGQEGSVRSRVVL